MAYVNVIDTFTRALTLVWKNLPAYLRTQGPFVVLAGVVTALASLLVLQSLRGFFVAAVADPSALDLGAVFQGVAAALALALVTSVIAGLLGLVGVFFGMVATDQLLQGGQPSLGGAWASMGARFGAFFGVAVVTFVVPMGIVLVALLPIFGLAFGGSLLGAVGLMVVLLPLALIAAVYLLLRWYLAPAAALLEGKATGPSLDRSSQLTHGVKLGILLLIILLGVVNAVASAIVEFPVALATNPAVLVPQDPATFDPATAFPGPAEILAQQVAATLVGLFFGPVFAAAIVLVHRNLAAPPAAAPPAFAAPAPVPPPAPPVDDAATQTASLATCPRCGSVRQTGATFCHACGTRFV